MSGSGFLFDANLWVSLAFPRHPHHARSVKAYARTSNAEPAVFCRAAQQSFLRLVSTPTLLQLYGAPGFTNDDALVLLDKFMRSPAVQFRAEPAGMVPLWHRLAGLPRASPGIWMDAYLAAFAISGKLKLVTFDNDFRVFEKDGLKLVMP